MRAAASPWTSCKITYDLETPWRLLLGETSTWCLTLLPPTPPCRVSSPDVVSECGLSELPSSIHSDDETEHDAFCVQTCVEEVENAECAAPLKPLLSMRGEEPLDDELDPRSRLREYVDSKRRLVAKKLCYARPTRRSWPLKQGSRGDISRLKEDLEQKITTWQREVVLKLMKRVWGAQVRTPEEDELSEECVCEPPQVCLCCMDHLRLWKETFSTPIKD